MKIQLGLGLLFLLSSQCQLSPVPAGGEELPPLVEGGDPRGEHDVERALLLLQAQEKADIGC